MSESYGVRAKHDWSMLVCVKVAHVTPAIIRQVSDLTVLKNEGMNDEGERAH